MENYIITLRVGFAAGEDITLVCHQSSLLQRFLAVRLPARRAFSRRHSQPVNQVFKVPQSG